MNIAVVGGGTRCKNLIDIIEQHTFEEIQPRVVVVAEPNPQACGLLKAIHRGLDITPDYNDLFRRTDIELIIELTGDMAVYNDILKKKASNVRAISERTAQLFWEISRISKLQKRCSQELQETRAMYKTTINELIKEDVMVIASNYQILDINESMLEKLGLAREEVIGRPCYEITHRRDLPCAGDHHPCPLVETIRTEAPTQTTHIHPDKDHREIYYSITTYPLIEDGEVIGAIELSRDITRDINMQRVMMQQEKLASIGRLSAGVAHEINNPLTTILTTSMLLQEDIAPDDPMRAELEVISNEALRCRKIVTSLLDFARQKKPRKEPCDINAVVRQSILLVKKQAAFRDIIVEDNLADDLPPTRADKGQIQQAVINLALNAIEATESGGMVAFSTLYLERGNLIEIGVSDTGSGIPPEILDKIIDPFFTTKETGNGLGLAITHGIVEQHRGTLDVMSEVGRGSCFVIRLPVEPGEGNAP